MTVQFDEDKPSIDDVLHYGVLGMKWGKTRPKATGADIRNARVNLNAKQGELFKAQNDLKAKKKAGTATKKDQDAVGKMTTDFLKNPDRAIAGRLTRGEKAVFAILAVPTGGTSLLTIAGTSAISRRIERKQETGAYDKKK